MKMLTMLLFFLLYSSQLYPQWIVSNPIPDPLPGQNYTSVHFVDILNGWIAGNNGVVAHTTDGGTRGMVWGRRREEGSGWGTHVDLWWILYDIWQN